MASLTIEVSDLVVAILERIDELDITEAEAARRLDVSPQRLNNWKRGTTVNLDGDLQASIASFLNTSPRRVVELLGLSVDSTVMRGYMAMLVRGDYNGDEAAG